MRRCAAPSQAGGKKMSDVKHLRPMGRSVAVCGETSNNYTYVIADTTCVGCIAATPRRTPSQPGKEVQDA